MKHDVHIIGAGLSGSEAALVLARNGVKVRLSEMRPDVPTPVHSSDNAAEIVCSNSLGSTKLTTASGCLKRELGLLSSPLINIAVRNSVPAGHALAVDREKFAIDVTSQLESEPNIDFVREEIDGIDPRSGSIPTLLATGPLTSDKLSRAISLMLGEDNLYFFDAISPTVEADSIDTSIAFFGARYEGDSDDYLNCPFNKEEYEAFHSAIQNAERIEIKDFEPDKLFEGCLPIEIQAQRGLDALRFAAMKPVGLTDPRTGGRPWAVVQLRREQVDTTSYSLVGFQTRLKYGEQEKVLRMIPGLGNAKFIRLGSMHRNSYLNSPKLLTPTLQFKQFPHIFVGGCLSGVEGYVEDITTGHIAGLGLAAMVKCGSIPHPPIDTLQGSLCKAITTTPDKRFQPLNATIGMLPPIESKLKAKKDRRELIATRCMDTMSKYVLSLRDSGYVIPDPIIFAD